jgi:hypothetical protein
MASKYSPSFKQMAYAVKGAEEMIKAHGFESAVEI